jgi:tetratricopeptide (TPR) repeat protein
MSKPNLFINTLVISIILVAFSSNIYSQTTYSSSIYIAFIHRDMNRWENVIHTIELSKSVNTINQKLEIINYYYGYIGYLIGKNEFDKAEKLITKGEKLINQVLHDSPKDATALSFKGSFMGFEIGTCKYKALFLGTESKNYINNALKIDPENVQALIDKGNILYYAPKLFGGDKKEALVYFLKGAKILEKNKETEQNWVYFNLLSIIASAYEKTDKLAEAKQIYEKILLNEPDLIWVKNDLYPNLLAKIKT